MVFNENVLAWKPLEFWLCKNEKAENDWLGTCREQSGSVYYIERKGLQTTGSVGKVLQTNNLIPLTNIFVFQSGVENVFSWYIVWINSMVCMFLPFDLTLSFFNLWFFQSSYALRKPFLKNCSFQHRQLLCEISCIYLSNKHLLSTCVPGTM